MSWCAIVASVPSGPDMQSPRLQWFRRISNCCRGSRTSNGTLQQATPSGAFASTAALAYSGGPRMARGSRFLRARLSRRRALLSARIYSCLTSRISTTSRTVSHSSRVVAQSCHGWPVMHPAAMQAETQGPKDLPLHCRRGHVRGVANVRALPSAAGRARYKSCCCRGKGSS